MAYNKITMEMILLLLLALSDKDGNMKRSLQQFLGFYKENRELIQMLANAASHPNNAESKPQTEEGSSSGQQESRPHDEIGNLNVFEEYLNRVNA